MTNKFQFFWNTMELCDWDCQGDDDQVLKPVIKYLSEQEDDRIFEFVDLMSELLYELDDEKLAEMCMVFDGQGNYSLLRKARSTGSPKRISLKKILHRE